MTASYLLWLDGPLALSFLVTYSYRGYAILWQRMEKIAATPPGERVLLYDEGQMITRFPIQYADVLNGFQQRVSQWEITAALGGDSSYNLLFNKLAG